MNEETAVERPSHLNKSQVLGLLAAAPLGARLSTTVPGRVFPGLYVKTAVDEPEKGGGTWTFLGYQDQSCSSRYIAKKIDRLRPQGVYWSVSVSEHHIQAYESGAYESEVHLHCEPL